MAATLEVYLTGNGTPNGSLGGGASSVKIDTSSSPNNLFDDVSATEANNGCTEYRAIAIKNDGDATAQQVVFYFNNTVNSLDTTIEFGLDSGTQSIADETTAPSGITFNDDSTQLSIPDIAAGSSVQLWIKRVIASGASGYAGDSFSFTVRYV